ncbi:microtubule-associated serine/threonine-protein kinase 2 [Galendromus occidentalis]|uniref:Serine/threonine-protein kinase greatwall n=1 Tax=Galendromus occidentalis TaxID=34638 RepID=A0AAJ6QV10_9ACAR|nr:microtubule-associated serine/threonine-protein kinase 2 [Galendromus occidentalis]
MKHKKGKSPEQGKKKGERGRLKPAEPLKKTAMQNVLNEHEKAAVTCLRLLSLQTKRMHKIRLENDPLHQFSLEQAFLVATEIYSKLESQILSHDLIQDLMANLICLQRERVKLYPEAVLPFAVTLKQLMLTVSEISNFLQRASAAPVTDWIGVSDKLVENAQAETANSQRHVKILDYVPRREHFRLLEMIARGSISNIYRVLHVPSDTIMALKITRLPRLDISDERQVTQCYVDKAVASMVSNPSVIKIFAVYNAKPNVSVLLMDGSIPRADLQNLVESVGFLDSESVALIILQVILAVEHIHMSGFIHRDVKPTNVLVDTAGHVKLVDFNCAKICRGHYTKRVLMSYFKRTASEFREKDSCGALAYTAPEILKGAPFGRSADWWSVGVLLYKISSTKTPFRSRDAAALRKKIVHDNFFWPKENSATVDAKEFTHDLLKKNPSERLGSKTYREFKEHNYIVFASKLLDDLVVKFKGKSTTYRDPEHKVFYTKCIMDMEPLFKNLKHSGRTTGVSTCPRFEDLEDEDKHQPLFTFSNIKFRKLLDRISSGEAASAELKLQYMSSITPPQADLDYSAPSNAYEETDTILETTKNEIDVYREAILQRQWVNMPLGGRPKQPLVDLITVFGDGNQVYPVVADTDFAQEEFETPLIKGDMIAAVNNNPVMDLSLEEVLSIIDKEIESLRPRVMTLSCQVLSRNPFRLFKTSATNALAAISSARMTRLTFYKPELSTEFLLTSLHTVWNTKTKAYESYHVISFVHPDSRILEAESVLFGDILVEIEGHPCADLSEDDVQARLQSPEKVVISVLELSILHRKDLLELSLISFD